MNTSSPTFDTYISNLTVENGRNTNDAFARGDAVNYEGGLIDGFNNSGAYLTLVNVTLNNGFCEYSSGGALEVGNLTGPATLTFEADASVIENSVSSVDGGGIDVGGYIRTILSGDQITGNQANGNATSGFVSGGGAQGFAGGLATYDQADTTYADTITNTVFSGNTTTPASGATALGFAGWLPDGGGRDGQRVDLCSTTRPPSMEAACTSSRRRRHPSSPPPPSLRTMWEAEATVPASV